MSPVHSKLRAALGGIVAAAAMLPAVCVSADQTLGNDPFREKDPGFFHRASNDVGNFFKRLFGTDEEKHPEKPAKSSSKKQRRSTGQRFNLDHPPEEVSGAPAGSNRAGSSAASRDAAGVGAKPKQTTRSTSRGSMLIEEPVKSKNHKPNSADSDSSPASANTAAQSGKPKKGGDDAATLSKSDNVPSSGAGTANAKPRTEAPPPKTPAQPPSVLTGTKTGKIGRVKSPYAPYSELDVTGLPSGSLALDPTTQKVFRIP